MRAAAWSWRARRCADGWRRWRRRCGRWWSGSGRRPGPATRSRPRDGGAANRLNWISQLNRLEDLADGRGLDAEAREQLRGERASPILERLDRWLQRTVLSEPPASALARACGYCRNQWPALTEFVHDGLLPRDNYRCERRIR